MSRIATGPSVRELDEAELRQVSGGGGRFGEGIGDIREGARDIRHGHIGEGIGDILEGIKDITGGLRVCN